MTDSALAWLIAPLVLLALGWLAASSPGPWPAALRLLAAGLRRRVRRRAVLELAVRLRLRHDPSGRLGGEPRFWVEVEFDTMPERLFLEICEAYFDLLAAGLPHEQILTRLELWRSRYGSGRPGLRFATLLEYLRYRMEIEFPGYGRLPSRHHRILQALFRWYAGHAGQARLQRAARISADLDRHLYTIRLSDHELALEERGVFRSIGWTDLERYLESDTLAVRVLSGDEIWSYSGEEGAGLALVRKGIVAGFTELATFKPKNARKPRRRQG